MLPSAARGSVASRDAALGVSLIGWGLSVCRPRAWGVRGDEGCTGFLSVVFMAGFLSAQDAELAGVSLKARNTGK
jgi:hypothetical protein